MGLYAKASPAHDCPEETLRNRAGPDRAGEGDENRKTIVNFPMRSQC